jgi:hypothetical protein
MGSSLTESAPEIPRHVRQIRRLIKFGPRNSIWVALLATNAELPLISGWALSRLVAWALFDQHESKRIPKQRRKTGAAKRPFKPTYAYKAGQLYLLYHADRFFRKYEETARFRKMTVKEGASAMAAHCHHFIMTKIGAAI